MTTRTSASSDLWLPNFQQLQRIDGCRFSIPRFCGVFSSRRSGSPLNPQEIGGCRPSYQLTTPLLRSASLRQEWLFSVLHNESPQRRNIRHTVGSDMTPWSLIAGLLLDGHCQQIVNRLSTDSGGTTAAQPTLTNTVPSRKKLDRLERERFRIWPSSAPERRGVEVGFQRDFCHPRVTISDLQTHVLARSPLVHFYCLLPLLCLFSSVSSTLPSARTLVTSIS
ncbi:hypothetical protein B0T25DRAFT_316255 [Lasiosphaeria hispida]|uniref:Uncharacterized protein n=1 Tax=Lasiosphaeria hispida TaxID=260671 RepID=A0AAJ0H9T3_9PEZI|nr:hypothetical protein B0T25DRAFT_316255 [Lasiosphaeria hispida]